MESIYWVMSWLCHRTCRHCYEDRFRPYQGADLDRVVSESRANFTRIINHLPEKMTYRDEASERLGSVILAGGEILLDPIRESVLYPALQQIWDRYQGQVKLIVQTTGDVLRPAILTELLNLHVWTVSVSGMDDFHDGLERLRAPLVRMFTEAGFELSPAVAEQAREAADGGRYYQFFGATPDLWIGKLWPRGRALLNGLSGAGMADNFCAQWSGGKGFLEVGQRGSEVSIEPNGNVFPCCLKTKVPVGNLLEEPLDAMLARLRGNPVYEAINAGEPDRMGVQHGWTPEKFREKSRILLPDGRVYENLCVGCDRFHEEVLVNITAASV
jgi:hypothetical protein